MKAHPTLTVWLVEDEPQWRDDFLEQLREAGLLPHCQVLWSECPNVTPSVVQPKTPASSGSDKRLRLDEVEPALFAAVDVVIADLHMPEWFDADNFPEGDQLEERFGDHKGLYVLDLLFGSWGFAGVVYVASAQLASLGGGLQDELGRYVAQTRLSVFDKHRISDLIDKLYSVWDLKQRGYSCNSSTREDLFLVASQALSGRSDPVLILGKSGTGKEDAARHIHTVGNWRQNGARVAAPMKTVHCGGLDSNLSRSELFGHVKGAFTGADTHTVGAMLLALGARSFPSGKAAAPRLTDLVKSFETAAADLGTAVDQLRQGQEDVSKPETGDPDGERSRELAARSYSAVLFATEALRRGAAHLGEFLGEEALAAKNLLQILATQGPSSSSAYAALLRKTLLFETPDQQAPYDMRIRPDAPFGTVFLDEFGDLPPGAQTLLLRFLEYGDFQPVGYAGTVSLVDAQRRHHLRVICSTNDPSVRRLVAAPPPAGAASNRAPAGAAGVLDGGGRNPEEERPSFRPDLVWRVARWVIELPELHEAELDTMIELERTAHREQFLHVVWPDEQKETLRRWIREGRFPGQRRELRTVLMRAMTYASDLPRIGAVLPGSEHLVTAAILDRAFYPIQIETRTEQAGDRPGQLQRALRLCFSATGLWPDCPEKLTTKDMQGRFQTLTGDKQAATSARCVAFVLSACLSRNNTGFEQQELEVAWGGKAGNNQIWSKFDRGGKVRQAVLGRWFSVDFQDGMKWPDVCGRVRNIMKSLDVSVSSPALAQEFVLENIGRMIQNALGTLPDDLACVLESLRGGERTEEAWRSLFAALGKSCNSQPS